MSKLQKQEPAGPRFDKNCLLDVKALYGSLVLIITVLLAVAHAQSDVASVTPENPPTAGAAAKVKHHVARRTRALVEMPEIGKFLESGGQKTYWSMPNPNGKGEIQVAEPINVVICVRATSPRTAYQKLDNALARAGFPAQAGHSGGFSARIGRQPFPQLPAGDGLAYANAGFLWPNDHGRFFGPLFWPKNQCYYFIGAFSSEKPDPQDVIALQNKNYFHALDSFTRARDNLASSLRSRADAKYMGTIPLNNAEVSNSNGIHRDHDGKAVLLSL